MTDKESTSGRPSGAANSDSYILGISNHQVDVRWVRDSRYLIWEVAKAPMNLVSCMVPFGETVARLTGTPVNPLGRIWPCSGSGSLSGQYITHGAKGSEDTFWTFPPLENARPEGVSSGCETPSGLVV